MLSFFVAHAVQAQTKVCTFANLSRTYKYTLQVDRHGDNEGKATVTITRPGARSGSTVSFPLHDWFGLEYKCTARSYTTHVNEKNKALDGDYGDLVVVDLNFDGREDIAIRSEYTNGQGSLYRIYLQGANGRFSEVKDMGGMYRKDEGTTFPYEIDAKHKILAFWHRAGATQAVNYYISYIAASKTWKRTVIRDYYENGKVVRSVLE